MSRTIPLPDGLYQVTHYGSIYRPMMWCAGFVIEDGELKFCAPILRRKIHEYWKYAKPIRSIPF